MSDDVAGDIAAYLLLYSKPSEFDAQPEPPQQDEIQRLAGQLRTAPNRSEVAAALIKEKRCVACHADLVSEKIESVPWRASRLAASRTPGCLAEGFRPQFPLDAQAREAIAAYAQIAAAERFDSAFENGRRQLVQAQCFRCHQGDSVSPARIEAIGQTLWTPHLMRLPYQRTPRLTQALSKYTREHLANSIRDGVSGIRPSWYSYKMPVYGDRAERIVEALAANDGEPLAVPAPVNAELSDPTLRTLGATLVGFEGYSCISCHIWKGRELTSVDPGSVGPELTSVTARIQRDWFTRWIENPPRVHPGTPMPAFFQKDKPAPIETVLDGKVSLQVDALWAYLSQGTNATDLEPKRSISIVLPAPEEPPLVAQIPVALGRGETLETICLQFGTHDLIVCDVPKGQCTATGQVPRYCATQMAGGLSFCPRPMMCGCFRRTRPSSYWTKRANPFTTPSSLPDTTCCQTARGFARGSRHRRLSLELSEEIRMPKEQERRLIRRWQSAFCS